MFSRDKLGAAAQDIANHLQLVDHVKALQDQQKSLADALSALGERLRVLELEMRTLKAETKLEALKEAQNVVFAVQGGLNKRIEDLAVKVEVLRVSNEKNSSNGRIGGSAAKAIPSRTERAESIEDKRAI